MLYALSLADGSTLPGWPIDVQAALTTQSVAFDSAHQGARGALLFFKNRLYVTYGGNSGDCQPYHGTVLQVAPGTHAIEAVWQTRADRGGIWAQGGISGDGGDLFVTTGNTSGTAQLGRRRGGHPPQARPRPFDIAEEFLRAVELEGSRRGRRRSRRHRGAAVRHPGRGRSGG